jgi:hypothetical protein
MFRALLIAGAAFDLLIALFLLVVAGWVIDSWHDPVPWTGPIVTAFWSIGFVLSAGAPLVAYRFSRRNAAPRLVAMAKDGRIVLGRLRARGDGDRRRQTERQRGDISTSHEPALERSSDPHLRVAPMIRRAVRRSCAAARHSFNQVWTEFNEGSKTRGLSAVSTQAASSGPVPLTAVVRMNRAGRGMAIAAA